VRARAIADVMGAIGSAVCAVHCLAGPLVLLTGAVLPSTLLPDESFHRAMLWLVLPTGTVAFALGCRQHKDLGTFLLGVVGLAAYGLAATTLHRSLGETGEKVVALLAAAALIAGHVRNFRLCRADACRHDCDTA
jgi:MerC mercury resistance protein